MLNLYSISLILIVFIKSHFSIRRQETDSRRSSRKLRQSSDDASVDPIASLYCQEYQIGSIYLEINLVLLYLTSFGSHFNINILETPFLQLFDGGFEDVQRVLYDFNNDTLQILLAYTLPQVVSAFLETLF